MRLSSILRRGWRELAYTALWKIGARLRAPHRAIFTRIYRQNEWGDRESRSGPGSTRARGADIRDALREILERYEIRSMLDAPCGDYNWMRDGIGRDVESYVGIDIVEELIARNTAQYADSAHAFLCRDITRDPLPRTDLVLCRDAFVHFSFADIQAAIENFRRSGAKYLLTTTFDDVTHNEDIRTGGWRAINLQLPPFSFPEPLALIFDVPRGASAAKRLALWELG